MESLNTTTTTSSFGLEEAAPSDSTPVSPMTTRPEKTRDDGDDDAICQEHQESDHREDHHQQEEENPVKATSIIIGRQTGEEDYVTLHRDELEALIDARVQEREVLLESRVESMVKAILAKNSNDVSQGQQSSPEEGNIELQKLVKKNNNNDDDDDDKTSDEWNVIGRGGKQDDDNDDWHSPFGESVYTLLYMCPCNSQGFWFAVFVYYLQIATIGLTLADAVDVDSKNNPLQLPPMVDLEVTYAQGVTIFLMFAYQSDLIEAVLKLGDGYHPELLDKYPGATFPTWLCSCLAQLGAGLLVLLASFILTMQASTVIDLMLNLTALLFISEIDDLGFFVAKYGFITNTLQAVTYDAMEMKVPKRKNSRNLYRRIICFLTMVGLFAGFFMLKYRQFNGYYLSTNIYVQFGDAYNPKIAHYSGILTAEKQKTQRHRKYRDIGTSKILLAYCQAERAWTFTEGPDNDPCHNYFAISYETKSYDVTSIPDSEWQVIDPNGRLQPFDTFSLVDRDCNPSTCQGTCGSNGLCECAHDEFGLDCEFSDNVCHEIIIDDRFPGFPQVLSTSLSAPKELESTAFGTNFVLLRNDKTNEYLHVYSMPVYYSNSSFPANIIFFGGRRWILTTADVLFNLIEARDENPDSWFFPDKIVTLIENGFHAHHGAQYTPFFMSAPVDFETPDFKADPVGIRWWTVKNTNPQFRQFVPDAPIDTVLVCGDAPPPLCLEEPESYCGPHGYCNRKTGLCVCCEQSGECNNETGLCGDCLDEGFYYGDRCELVKPCYDQLYPCNDGRGNCDETSGICSCNMPWYGQACLALHKCIEEGGTCLNGGECNIASGSCDCPADPAITGAACEETADCEEFGCANGGVCGWTGKCICRPPYQGAHCDLVDKTQELYFCFSNEDCMNGTCNLDTGFCDCTDPSAYGPRCEHSFNCSHTPGVGYRSCLNEGTCNGTSGVCDCLEPYYGPDCSQLPPCMSDEDCWGPWGLDYFGACDVESGVCMCRWGKRGGMYCEKDRFLCYSDSDCYGLGSTCSRGICHCESGRGGRHCYSYIGDEYLPYQEEFHQMAEESVKLCGFEDPMCCFQNETGFPELKYHRC